MTQHSKALRVMTAPNPSPLTGPGTNTFLLGQARVAVIDPGPDLPAHRAAILEATREGQITHIFVTHAHLDHSGGATALSRATGAPIHAFGPPTAGRSPLMQHLALQGGLVGGEGMDHAFRPDILMADGDTVQSSEWALTALHTPGHFAGHLAFRWDDTIFCGDVVMGWSSTLISPPDGDLADYFRTLARLDGENAARLLPAHGEPVENPSARIAELAAHRRERTAQILRALADAPGDALQLATRIYDIPGHLLPAATRNVLAHLIALAELGAVRPLGPLSAATVFHAV